MYKCCFLLLVPFNMVHVLVAFSVLLGKPQTKSFELLWTDIWIKAEYMLCLLLCTGPMSLILLVSVTYPEAARRTDKLCRSITFGWITLQSLVSCTAKLHAFIQFSRIVAFYCHSLASFVIRFKIENGSTDHRKWPINFKTSSSSFKWLWDACGKCLRVYTFPIDSC